MLQVTETTPGRNERAGDDERACWERSRGKKEEKEKRYVISCTYSGELKDEVQS
jgi:hypothetical protein